jgi:3',5'-cyclic AMP phosphodiesterase CpdA
MRRLVHGLVGLALGLGITSCGDAEVVGLGGGPAGSTLRATLADPDGDGALRPGPAEPLLDRDDLAPPAARGRTLATIGQLTDTHVRDEESPGRVPFLDRFGGSFRSTFRPQESLSTQVLAGAVQTLNRERPQAVVVTGDIIDNAQANELAQARAVLDGGTVRPDTGAPGYDGVQQSSSPDPFYYRPDQDAPRHPGLLAAAQRPFVSTGLRAPWYPALGNHDLLRQGELERSARTDSVATGARLVTSLDPEFRLSEKEDSSAAVERLLDAGIPGAAISVPADPQRRALVNDELVGLLGRGRDLRSPERLDYVFDVGQRVRGIVLDTVNRRGGARGIVSAAQVDWLSEQLAAAGSREVIVFSHNRLESSDGGGAAVAALAASPAVVANVAGNVHRNRVRPHVTAAGGYWVIETSALADFPQQGRMLRLSETPGGGRVLETWMVEQEGRGMAGVARELAFLDAQGGRPQGHQGVRGDRNVRLFLPSR